jgi:hypothetical protein
MQIILIILALFLLIVGFAFTTKDFFYVLIEKTPENQRFLKSYGSLFIILGILSFVLLFYPQKIVVLLLLALMLFFSAIFSLQFAKRMK